MKSEAKNGDGWHYLHSFTFSLRSSWRCSTPNRRCQNQTKYQYIIRQYYCSISDKMACHSLPNRSGYQRAHHLLCSTQVYKTKFSINLKFILILFIYLDIAMGWASLSASSTFSSFAPCLGSVYPPLRTVTPMPFWWYSLWRWWGLLWK